MKTGKTRRAKKSTNYERKLASKRAKRLNAAEEERLLREALAKVDAPNFLRRELADLKRHGLAGQELIAMLGLGLDRRILEVMDLPNSKKKLLRNIFYGQSNAAKAMAFPITRKSALKLIDDNIRITRTGMAEMRKPTERGKRQCYELIRMLEKNRAKVEAGQGRVTIDPSLGNFLVQNYTYMIRRIAGPRSIRIMDAVIKEARPIIMAISAEFGL